MRRATFVSPSTGQLSRQPFTLREASHLLAENGRSTESTPLLSPNHIVPRSSNPFIYFRDVITDFYEFVSSKNGRGVLKCSLAYLLASFMTLIPVLSGMMGNKLDSKHMVATVTVWFHPARTVGSMHWATVLGLLGFLYAGVIGFTSMGISIAFHSQDLVMTSHVFILLVFIGGGKSRQ
jgi:hypothetical protein